jgi:hypothetical protein
LKLRFPDRFDGVALVLGAAAPDLGYVLAGIAEPPSHAWHSLLWFHLPVVTALAWVVRGAAPAVAAHLPGRLRDYGVIGAVRHPLLVTAYSGVLGALTHQLWDAVTHPYMLFFGPSAYLPAMHATAVAGLPWWRVVQLLSEVVGAVVTIGLIVHIGRKDLLRTWHGPPPWSPQRRSVFWPTAILSAAALATASLALPGNDIGIWIVGARWLGAGVLGLLVAAAATSVTSRPSLRRSTPVPRAEPEAPPPAHRQPPQHRGTRAG